MNLEKCVLLSKIEFGNTYQGTADEHSDRDYMSLVVQPLSDTVFRNSEKSSKHTEESRYYAVERFISLILKSGLVFFLLTFINKYGKIVIYNKEEIKDGNSNFREITRTIQRYKNIK